MKITDLIPWRSSRPDGALQTEALHPIQAFRQDIDRAFDNFWRMLPLSVPTLGRSGARDPVRVDVSDSDKEVTISAELPGLSEDDISVFVRDGELTIRGEKRTDRQAEDGEVIVRERVYGTFERTIQLPDGVDGDAARASFKNGVLAIELPKTAASVASVKRIPVQAG